MLFAFDPRHIHNEVSLISARDQVTQHATTSVLAGTCFRAARTTRFAVKLNNDFDGRGRSIKANINHMSRRFDFHYFLVEFVGMHVYKVTVRGRRFDQSIARQTTPNLEPKNARFGQPCGWKNLENNVF